MLGLAVDPQFSTNRYVYTCHSSRAGPVPDNRVVQLVLGSLAASAVIGLVSTNWEPE